jgi:hypothetical protein
MIEGLGAAGQVGGQADVAREGKEINSHHVGRAEMARLDRGRPENARPLAERIERETQQDWRRDAFTGLALCYAVEMFLQHFAPAADGTPAVPPAVEQAVAKMLAEFAERYRKPAGLGHLCAHSLITEIKQAPTPAEPASMIDEWTIWGLPGFPNVPPPNLGQIRLDLKEDKS